MAQFFAAGIKFPFQEATDVLKRMTLVRNSI